MGRWPGRLTDADARDQWAPGTSSPLASKSASGELKNLLESEPPEVKPLAPSSVEKKPSADTWVFHKYAMKRYSYVHCLVLNINPP